MSGTNADKLKEVAARYADDYRWSLQVAGLEEAFIYLMTGARDNFAGDGAGAAGKAAA